MDNHTIEEIEGLKELNVQLIEHVGSIGMWILKYCERNRIRPPDADRLLDLIQRSREIVQKMYEPPTDSQQRNKTTDDSTEHKI